MKQLIFPPSILLLSVMVQAQYQYPPTKTVDIVDTLWGVAVADPYRWLEDLKDSEVGDWSKAQANNSGSVSATTKTGAQTQEEELVKNTVINSFDSIWSALDTSAVTRYYTSDFLLIEHQEVWGIDSVMAYIDLQSQRIANLEKQGRRLERVNEFEFIHVSVHQATAYVVYHNRASFTVDGKESNKAHWIESAFLTKSKDGQWGISVLHNTDMKEDR